MTSAQRARLVVALGLLNLVLATLAFAVGITVPEVPPDGVAVVPSPTAPAPVSLPPAETPPPQEQTPEPTQPASTPAPTPTAAATPSAEPTAILVPTGVVIVARPPQAAEPTVPAPTPDPTATPGPTDPPPNPTPTAKPKPKPTPAPAAKPQAHPPCPSTVDGPPGHNKGEPWEKPCGKGNSGGGSDNGKDAKSGVVIVLPLALSMALAGGRRRIADSLRRRPSAR